MATTTTVKTTLERCRLSYGASGPSLMAALKRDGFDGRTLAERADRWADAHPLPTVDEPADLDTDGTDTDLEPTAEATDLEPATASEPTADPLPLPEPELIPADAPTDPAAVAVVPTAPPVVPIPVPTFTPTRPASGGGGVNLTDASRQWANRPADERYWTVADALEATKHHRETAREVSFAWQDAALAPAGEDGSEIALILPDGTEATLTNYSARQLCADVGAPHAYLAKLPTDLAVNCLEHGLSVHKLGTDRKGHPRGGNALVHQNGHTKLRSLTSDKYARFWNCEVFEALLPLTERGWRTPPARPANLADARDTRIRRATAEDVLTRRDASGGIAVNVGDWISPAGIYASDHDMFAFLINEGQRIDDGTPDGLARGFFVSNSEVGAGALKLKAFWYRQVCGNHIVWGAEHVVEVNVRHVGTFDGIRQKFAVQVKAALDSFTADSLAEDQAIIDRARNLMLTTATDPATARKEVLNALIAGVSGGRTLKPASGISVGMFEKALDFAVQFADVDKVHPFSLWGAVNGLTRYSQSADVGLDYADERARVDALTGKLMKLAGAQDRPALAV